MQNYILLDNIMIKVLQTLFASGDMNRFHGFSWNLCSFTVLTKCDKKGLSCPQYSKCKKLPSGSYDSLCTDVPPPSGKIGRGGLSSPDFSWRRGDICTQANFSRNTPHSVFSKFPIIRTKPSFLSPVQHYNFNSDLLYRRWFKYYGDYSQNRSSVPPKFY